MTTPEAPTINAAVSDMERVLVEVFAAYNHIPAGNPSWSESFAAIGKLLDTVARGQQLLGRPSPPTPEPK